MSREAMKLALEALEPDWELAEWFVDELREKAITALKQALEQPEPEPVAWMSPNKERLEFSRKDTVYGSHTIPLYTSPPKREWQGLTDKEVQMFIDARWGDGVNFTHFIRAVEAKLKEKNT